MRQGSTIPTRYLPKRGWSLILFDEMGRVFHFAIPRKWVRNALIWGTILLLLAVGVFSRYVYVESQMQMIADKKRMLEEVKMLQEQLRTAYQTEAELRKKVDELSRRLHIEKGEQDTRKKDKRAGAGGDKAVLAEAVSGIGGGSPESINPDLIVDEDSLEQLDDIFLSEARTGVDHWKSLWSSLRARLEGLEEEVQRRERLMATIPSGPPVLRSLEISSRFGSRISPFGSGKEFHSGVDIRADYGDPIVATADGTVVLAGWMGRLGRTIKIAHSSGFTTVYGHLMVIMVKRGDRVRKGEVIGQAGSSGRSTGPHLHYEVQYKRRALNPVPFLNLTIERVDELLKKYRG